MVYRKPYGRIALSDLSPSQISQWTIQAEAGNVVETPERQDDHDAPSLASTTLRLRRAMLGELVSAGLRCNACEVSAFESLYEQNEHYKSPAHCMNLKRRAKGLPRLSEQEMLQQLQKEAKKNEKANFDTYDSLSSSPSDSEEELGEVASKKEPVVEFSDGTSTFKVFKNILSGVGEKTFNPHTSLQKVCLSKFRWAVLLLRSGRFAGAVFDKEKALCHKTFQRYTTRRKQGGAQSASDANRKVKSAGATLRRYNEVALKQDVAALLLEWKNVLDDAELIFISSGKTERATFFPEKSNVLQPGDKRLKRIPFTTFRPTFEEVCRVYSELRTVRFAPLASKEKPLPGSIKMLKKKNSKKSCAPAPETVQKAEATVVVKKEELPLIIQLVISDDMIRLKELLSNADEGDVSVNAADANLMTALHHAAANNLVLMVEYLLQHGADPALLDLHNRPPYYLCSIKETRNTFRRYMGKHPDAWDYKMAQIPEGLTAEMEQRKSEKEAEKRKRAKDRKKQQKKEAAEQRRIEAERQEELDRKIAMGMSCGFCSKYAGKSPLTRLEYKYCSTDCVNSHKRQLMSEAALRRFTG
ncbi:hypothetical protein CCR75_008289 [Bremia lactucae]|uniref:VLRF1 domain-containing protein n=1 Tax=Bremia lactucae TaxID=4779 RepID=A0A976IGF1_BRELC|nr:hypothetical protein CCR75_009093 [Bremia lactucae]TDH71692.1 hypothetical protein CCR75_008289 [Bremia lactucae]